MKNVKLITLVLAAVAGLSFALKADDHGNKANAQSSKHGASEHASMMGKKASAKDEKKACPKCGESKDKCKCADMSNSQGNGSVTTAQASESDMSSEHMSSEDSHSSME